MVESLWSKQDALVDQRRSRMSPSMAEAILFLKENRDLWDIEQVREALMRVKANANWRGQRKRCCKRWRGRSHWSSWRLGWEGLNVDYSSE